MRSPQHKGYACDVLRRHLIEAATGCLALAAGLSLSGFAFSLSEDKNGAPVEAIATSQDSEAPRDGRLQRPRTVASYTLEAALDPVAHTVDGEGVLTWTNTSRKAVTELWFHLYLNAFKNDETLFLRNVRSKGENKKGGIEIESLSVREFGSDFGDNNLWKNAAKQPHAGRPRESVHWYTEQH